MDTKWHHLKLQKIVVTMLLQIVFEELLKKGIFPEIWKKAKVVPVHQKEEKTVIKHYRPISLLLPVYE